MFLNNRNSIKTVFVNNLLRFFLTIKSTQTTRVNVMLFNNPTHLKM